jgi:uncharacterized membrane protein
MYLLALTFILFFIYAFLGRVHETLYFLVVERNFKTTSFLRLPIKPIYGIGAVAIDLLISPYAENAFLVFIASVALVTIIEYIGHLLIEKIFHIELWNYDHKKLNFQGRISVESSLGFGILALLVVYVLHPFLTTYLTMIPPTVMMIVALVLFILVLVDFANSVTTLIRIRASHFSGTLDEIQKRIRQRLEETRHPSPDLRIRLRRLKTLFWKLHRANVRRLRRAFPQARIKARRK